MGHPSPAPKLGASWMRWWTAPKNTFCRGGSPPHLSLQIIFKFISKIHLIQKLKTSQKWIFYHKSIVICRIRKNIKSTFNSIKWLWVWKPKIEPLVAWDSGVSELYIMILHSSPLYTLIYGFYILLYPTCHNRLMVKN